MGSPAQGVVGAFCRASGDVKPGTPAWGDGESSPGGFLQGLLGRRTGHIGLGGWGVQFRGWWEFSAGPAGMDNRAKGAGGASCRACGDVQPGTPVWGDGESCPGAGRSFLQGVRGWTTGRTGLGDGESCPGAGRSVLQGLWGHGTGHSGLGGRRVLPRRWSECNAGPVGR